MNYFIAIAGNIGAGKSCFAKKLANHFNWEYYKEPFDENPYLERFYQDMNRWALPCETHFLTQRLKTHLDIVSKESSIIQDRCIYETEIFSKNLYLYNNLNKKDRTTFKELYESIIPTLKAPDLIIYLKSSPERCLGHIKKRNRELDRDIDKNYIENLHKLYTEWQSSFELCPILTIDCAGKDFKHNDAEFFAETEKIMQKLQKAQKTST